MSFVSKFLITGAIGAAAIAHIDVALACSLPYPSVLSRHIFPNGEDDVALDARVILQIQTQNLTGGMQPIDTTTFLERAGFELTTAAGDPVETELFVNQTDRGLTLFFTPKTPLSPNTEYVISDKLIVNGGSSMEWTVPFHEEALEIARFKTGEAAVGGSPGAISTVTADEAGQACNDSGCCGPYDAVAMTLTFEPPELGLLARIEREVDGEFEPVAWVSGGFASGWTACMGGWAPSPDFRGGGTYRVRYEGPSPALGVPSEAVTLTGQCGEDEPEGPIGEPNPPVEEEPGAGPEAGERADGPDSGCAGGGAGALGWIGLGLLLRRRAATRC